MVGVVKPRACLLCGQGIDHEYETRDGWWFRCSGCRSLINADVKDSTQFYTEGFYTLDDEVRWGPVRKSLENLRAQLYLAGKWPFRVPWLPRLLRRADVGLDQTILDWGCGYHGMYVELMRAYGFRAEGFDPHSPRFSEPWHKEFDWVLMRHVLEHVADPVGVLAGLNTKRLLLVIPVADAPAMLRDKTKKISLCPSHYYVPSASALANLLADGGFVVEDAWLDDPDDAFVLKCQRL